MIMGAVEGIGAAEWGSWGTVRPFTVGVTARCQSQFLDPARSYSHKTMTAHKALVNIMPSI